MSPAEILLRSRVEVAPETFAVVSLGLDRWKEVVSDPELSPRMTAPFLVFMDRHEVTLILDSVDLDTIRPGLSGARISGGYRLLTFDTVLDRDLAGLAAEVSQILDRADIPILSLFSYSRDHILIKQADLADTLKALSPFVADVC